LYRKAQCVSGDGLLDAQRVLACRRATTTMTPMTISDVASLSPSRAAGQREQRLRVEAAGR
jgi:hypothetical protein